MTRYQCNEHRECDDTHCHHKNRHEYGADCGPGMCTNSPHDVKCSEVKDRTITHNWYTDTRTKDYTKNHAIIAECTMRDNKPCYHPDMYLPSWNKFQCPHHACKSYSEPVAGVYPMPEQRDVENAVYTIQRLVRIRINGQPERTLEALEQLEYIESSMKLTN